jgi:hypothetical protein
MAAVGVEVRLPRRQLVSISPTAPAPVSINGDDLGVVVESEFQRSPVLPVGQCGLGCAIVNRAPLHTRARKQRGRIIDRLRKVAMQRGRVELGPVTVACKSHCRQQLHAPGSDAVGVRARQRVAACRLAHPRRSSVFAIRRRGPPEIASTACHEHPLAMSRAASVARRGWDARPAEDVLEVAPDGGRANG